MINAQRWVQANKNFYNLSIYAYSSVFLIANIQLPQNQSIEFIYVNTWQLGS